VLVSADQLPVLDDALSRDEDVGSATSGCGPQQPGELVSDSAVGDAGEVECCEIGCCPGLEMAEVGAAESGGAAGGGHGERVECVQWLAGEGATCIASLASASRWLASLEPPPLVPSPTGIPPASSAENRGDAPAHREVTARNMGDGGRASG